MVTTKPVDTREPKITPEEILFLQDENFNRNIMITLTVFKLKCLKLLNLY